MYGFMALALCAVAAAQTNPQDLKAELEKRYKGKMFYLRDFPENNDLKYKLDGTPEGAIRPGPWTLGIIAVKKVEVNSSELVFKGGRIVLLYDFNSKKLKPNRSDDDIKIHISLAGVNGEVLESAWKNVFIDTSKDITDLLPVEWRRFNRGETKSNSPADKNIQRIKSGTSPPKQIYSPEARYNEIARDLRIEGSVLLQVVIDENGDVSGINVVRPVGAGLDEEAIKAVSKWKFQPAQKAGKPVSMYANIEVQFTLSRE